MSAEKLDFIIFGASGFTGKYTVFEACSVLENFKWGIAGRNRSKLEAVLKDMGAKANKNLMNTPIIIADIADEKSLVEMAKRCRVLVNFCSRRRFYREPVVYACIEAGTHHVDVSEEPQYIKTMQLKYYDQARLKNVYIISACDFESIATDVGLIFMERNFDGFVKTVQTYWKCYTEGAGIHYGTWKGLFLPHLPVDRILIACFFALIAVLFAVMTKFSLGRRLLLKYSRFFSMGRFSLKSPSKAAMERTYFTMSIKGFGWPQSTDQYTNPPSKLLMVKVSSPNPVYGATCVALLCFAVTVLKENDKMPYTGGVFPPGIAFDKTSLISELEKHEHGIKFEILANN